VVLSFLYRLIHRLLELVAVYRMDSAAKDAEILVLRRQVAGLVPRDRWRSFLITPRTILDWHRSVVRRRWTS
jgi:hypothetical protein